MEIALRVSSISDTICGTNNIKQSLFRRNTQICYLCGKLRFLWDDSPIPQARKLLTVIPLTPVLPNMPFGSREKGICNSHPIVVETCLCASLFFCVCRYGIYGGCGLSGCGVVAAVGRNLLRLLCCGCVTLLWLMFCMALSRCRISYFGIGKTSGCCMIILETRQGWNIGGASLNKCRFIKKPLSNSAFLSKNLPV